MKSIIDGNEDGRCYLCGRFGYTETHHMMHGIRRAAADKYGLTVELCRTCHSNVHDKGLLDEYLEREAQKAFEKNHSREEWMREFGKNYL